MKSFEVRYRLAGLSNSNELQGGHRTRERLIARRDRVFDDLASNIHAAKSAGMRAHQVRGVDELRERLVNEGFL